MSQLDLLGLERLQEETRRAMAEHCEREWNLRRALTRVVESYNHLWEKAPPEAADVAAAFLGPAVRDARLVLGE